MKIKFFVSIVILLLSATTLSASDLNWEGFVSAKTAHVYAKPDDSSERLRTLTSNIKVVAIKQEGGWFYIDVAGKKGWVGKIISL